MTVAQVRGLLSAAAGIKLEIEELVKGSIIDWWASNP